MNFFFFLLKSGSFNTIFKKPKGQEDLLISFFSKGFLFLSLNLGLYFQLILCKLWVGGPTSFFFFFFYTWINHFKVQEWRTRWNWKHRTIFHSFLQLSPLLFTSFKFNSLCEEIQSIEFVAQCTWNHSFLCAWETLCVIGRSVLGTYILYSAGHVWGTPETRRVI